LVEHFSWNSIFYINVPIGFVGLVMTGLVVRESRDPSKSRRLDPPGLVTGTAGLFFLVYGLIEGNARGWSDSLIIGSFVLSAALLVIFFYVESHRDSPMLPLSFFRNPTFAASNVVAAAVFFALFGVIFFLALYLQNVEGYSPVGAGVRLFAFSGVILVVAPIAGRLSDRYGSRWFMTIGPLIAAVGMGLMLRTEVGSSYATVLLPSFLVLAAGLACTMTPMTAAVMASVDPGHAGVASAATNTSRELGGVFGIALLGAIVTSSFRHGLTARLIDGGVAPADAASTVHGLGPDAAAGSARSAGGDPVIAQAIHSSFVHAIHIAMLVALGFLLLAAIVSALFVRDAPRGAKGSGRAAPEKRETAAGTVARTDAAPSADGMGGGDAPARRLAEHGPGT
jgi:MFS family permease